MGRDVLSWGRRALPTGPHHHTSWESQCRVAERAGASLWGAGLCPWSLSGLSALSMCRPVPRRLGLQPGASSPPFLLRAAVARGGSEPGAGGGGRTWHRLSEAVRGALTHVHHQPGRRRQRPCEQAPAPQAAHGTGTGEPEPQRGPPAGPEPRRGAKPELLAASVMPLPRRCQRAGPAPGLALRHRWRHVIARAAAELLSSKGRGLLRGQRQRSQELRAGARAGCPRGCAPGSGHLGSSCMACGAGGGAGPCQRPSPGSPEPVSAALFPDAGRVGELREVRPLVGLQRVQVVICGRRGVVKGGARPWEVPCTGPCQAGLG